MSSPGGAAAHLLASSVDHGGMLLAEISYGKEYVDHKSMKLFFFFLVDSQLLTFTRQDGSWSGGEGTSRNG